MIKRNLNEFIYGGHVNIHEKFDAILFAHWSFLAINFVPFDIATKWWCDFRSVEIINQIVGNLKHESEIYLAIINKKSKPNIYFTESAPKLG